MLRKFKISYIREKHTMGNPNGGENIINVYMT